MFNIPDPTHIFFAKYFTKQNVIEGADGKTYKWDEFIAFRCKTVKPRSNRYEKTNAGFQRVAPDSVFLETKRMDINYTVGDYVQYEGVTYQVKSAEKDITKVSPQSALQVKFNPNTYWTLELSEIQIMDFEKGENANAKQ